MYGWSSENGPWLISQNGTLRSRPTSWNKQTHMIWIDSPAGVGYSYDLSSSTPTTGDNQTRFDLHRAIVILFRDKFPELAGNPFYVSGESYGGHYVPLLTWTILNENKKPNAFKINLAGMLVGNPWTDDNIDGGSTVDWIYSHALVSLDAYQAVNQECGNLKFSKKTHDRLSARDFLMSHVAADPARRVGSCDSAMQRLYNEIGNQIDQYDIYTPCVNGKSALQCEDDSAASAYLSASAVLNAMHVRTQYIQLPWAVCGGINFAEAWESVVKVYPEIISALSQSSANVMVYSGDVTWNCDFIGSQRWIQTLNMTRVNEWQNYLDADNQVAGFVEQWGYNGNPQFTFATLRDSGHMGPLYQPDRAFLMLQNYFSGNWN